jgi:hypothetical protein
MKTRERLGRIKEAKFDHEKLWLARDVVPGTELDMKIVAVCQAKDPKIYVQGAMGAIIDLGEELAEAIRTGNAELFRQYADAIEAHKRHKPVPEKLRAAIIRYCIPSNRSFAMRDIHAELKRRRFVIDAALITNSWRIVKELGIKTIGKPGRPRK